MIRDLIGETRVLSRLRRKDMGTLVRAFGKPVLSWEIYLSYFTYLNFCNYCCEIDIYLSPHLLIC